MSKNYIFLEKKINIRFKNKETLLLSLTHKSVSTNKNNEKLEFLGDRVLALIISKRLFNLYPNESEGSLDKKFASLVNRKVCLKISKAIELDKFLILGNVYNKKKYIEDKILADACEALIGAIYLDSGYEIAEKFILNYWDKEIKNSAIVKIDSKTKLQEYSLKLFKKLPDYKTMSHKGPQHNPIYRVSVKISDSKIFYGTGNSKKNAEHSAASKLIKFLKLK